MLLRSIIILLAISFIFSNCGKNSSETPSDTKTPSESKTNADKSVFTGGLNNIEGEQVDGWLPEKLIIKNSKKVNFDFIDGSPEKPHYETSAYFFTYKGHLGFFVQCFDDDMSHLIFSHTVRDDNIWQDDNIEINIDVLPESNEDDIQICVNPIGTFSDSKGKFKESWNSNVQVKSKIIDRQWMIQVLLPINEIASPEQLSGLKANVSRTRNGRGNSMAEDTAWKKTFSLRANLPKFYGALKLPQESINYKITPEEKIDISQVSENKLADFLKNEIGNQVIICKPGLSEIKINGQLDEIEWRYQKSNFLNTLDHRNNPNLQDTYFKSFYNENTLYIGITCNDNYMAQLNAKVRENGKDIWEDDSIELFLGAGRTSTYEYLHLVVNPLSSLIKEIGKGKLKKGEMVHLDTLVEEVQCVALVNDKSWTVEIKIPLQHYYANSKTISNEWGFNITRYRPRKPSQPSQTSSWADLLSLDSHQPGKFGMLWLLNKNPVSKTFAERMERSFKSEVKPTTILANYQNQTSSSVSDSLKNTNWDYLSEILKPEQIANITEGEFTETRKNQIKARNENWNQVFQSQTFPAYQAEMRQNFIKSIGGFPERTPLNTKKYKIFQCEEYEIYNILYESMPKHYVTANLYQPVNLGEKKIPIIIKIIGHSTPGKNSKGSLSFADHLVRQGYAVLVIDSLGQGERIYINQGNGSRTPTSNHFAMGAPCVLLGQNIAKYFVWDVIRAVDLILETPNFDPQKIILTGESGGGTVTSYVAALDERISGAASCSAMGSEVFATGGHDCEQQLADCYTGNFDSMGRTAMIAPRPYVILSEYGTEEGLKNNYEMIDQAKMGFRFFGKEANLEYYPTKEPHGYGPGHRKIFFKWLSKYFPANNNFSMEEKKPLFNDLDALRVTKTWRVYYSRELSDRKTLFAMDAAIFEKAQKTFNKYYQNNGSDLAQQAILNSLNIKPEEARGCPIVSFQKVQIQADITAEKCYIKPSETITIPMLMVYKGQNASDKIIIWVNQRGKDITIKSRFEHLLPLLNDGYTICLPDLRSMGELSQDDSINHFSFDTDMAFFSIKLGKSYLGRMVLDAWCIEKSLKLLKPNAKISLVGDSLAKLNPQHIRQDRLLIDDGLEDLQSAESIGPLVTLMLAALEPDCQKSVINGGLSSYGNVFEDFYFYHPVSSFVNGIASKIDLPEICLSVAPRKLTLVNTVNAKNQLMQQFPIEMSKYQKIKDYLQRKDSSANSLKIEQGDFKTILLKEFE